VPVEDSAASALRRIAFGLVALGLVTLGLRERGATLASHPARSSTVVALPAAIAAFLALAMVWAMARSLHRRRKRSPEGDHHVEGYPSSRWSRPLALLAALVVLALPALLLWATLTTIPESGTTTSTPTTAPPSPTVPGPQPGQLGGPHAAIWLSMLAGAVLLGILLIGVLQRMLRRAGHTKPSAQAPNRALARKPLPTVEDPDPRAAVVACFRAFEDAAATQGVPIGASETARDIARHAVAEQVAPPAGVADLTRLFYLARYSTHPIGRAERGHARALLARLRDDMERSP